MANQTVTPALTPKPVTPPPKIPVATAKPVTSIHGESPIHKTHWAFIAGILGVFLVLETIFTGWYYMQKSTQADQRLVEDLQVQQLSEETQPTTTPEAEMTEVKQNLFSHLVLNPDPKLITDEQDAAATYLRSQISAAQAKSPCTFTTKVADASLHWQGGVAAEGLADPAVAALFSSRISIVGKSRVANLITAYDSALMQVCQGEQSDYLILINADQSLAYVATYDAVREYWDVAQPFKVIDGGIGLIPDFFKERAGAPLILTGYGDAGTIWWQYWTPLFAGVVQLLEDCETNIHTVIQNDLETQQGRELTCQLEYLE